MEETPAGAAALCIGCLRTLDEIAAWATLSDAEKSGVWQHIGERRARLEEAKQSEEAERADSVQAPHTHSLAPPR